MSDDIFDFCPDLGASTKEYPIWEIIFRYYQSSGLFERTECEIYADIYVGQLEQHIRGELCSPH